MCSAVSSHGRTPYVCPFLSSCPFVRAYGCPRCRVHASGSGTKCDKEDLRSPPGVCVHACVHARGKDHTHECRLLSLTEPGRGMVRGARETERDRENETGRIPGDLLADRDDPVQGNRRLPSRVYATTRSSINSNIRRNFRSGTATLYSYFNPGGPNSFVRDGLSAFFLPLFYPRAPDFKLAPIVAIFHSGPSDPRSRFKFSISISMAAQYPWSRRRRVTKVRYNGPD